MTSLNTAGDTGLTSPTDSPTAGLDSSPTATDATTLLATATASPSDTATLAADLVSPTVAFPTSENTFSSPSPSQTTTEPIATASEYASDTDSTFSLADTGTLVGTTGQMIGSTLTQSPATVYQNTASPTWEAPTRTKTATTFSSLNPTIVALASASSTTPSGFVSVFVPASPSTGIAVGGTSSPDQNAQGGAGSSSNGNGTRAAAIAVPLVLVGLLASGGLGFLARRWYRARKRPRHTRRLLDMRDPDAKEKTEHVDFWDNMPSSMDSIPIRGSSETISPKDIQDEKSHSSHMDVDWRPSHRLSDPFSRTSVEDMRQVRTPEPYFEPTDTPSGLNEDNAAYIAHRPGKQAVVLGADTDNVRDSRVHSVYSYYSGGSASRHSRLSMADARESLIDAPGSTVPPPSPPKLTLSAPDEEDQQSIRSSAKTLSVATTVTRKSLRWSSYMPWSR